MGEVGAAVLLKNLAVPLVHQRKAEANHFLVGDRLAVHWPQRAVDTDHRRLVDFEMQVAGLELHASAEQLVDLKIGFAVDEATFKGVVFSHGTNSRRTDNLVRRSLLTD